MTVCLSIEQIDKLKLILEKLYSMHGNVAYVVELSSIVDEIVLQEQSNALSKYL